MSLIQGCIGELTGQNREPTHRLLHMRNGLHNKGKSVSFAIICPEDSHTGGEKKKEIGVLTSNALKI